MDQEITPPTLGGEGTKDQNFLIIEIPVGNDVQVVKIPRTYNADGSVTARISQRTTVTLSELNAARSIDADKMVGAIQSPAAIMKYYGLFSLVGLVVNDQAVPLHPLKNDLDVRVLAQKMTAREATTLGLVYAMEFGSNELGDDNTLKN